MDGVLRKDYSNDCSESGEIFNNRKMKCRMRKELDTFKMETSNRELLHFWAISAEKSGLTSQEKS